MKVGMRETRRWNVIREFYYKARSRKLERTRNVLALIIYILRKLIYRAYIHYITINKKIFTCIRLN